MHNSFVRGESPSGQDESGGRPLVDPALLARLRSAVEGDLEPNHRAAHAVTLALLDRSDRAAEGNYPDGWPRFLRAANRLIGENGWGISVGVLANMIGVVHFAEPADFIDAARLSKRYGHRKIVSMQNTVDELLGTGPEQPVATRWVLTLAMTGWVVEKLLESGMEKSAAVEVADRCYQGCFWLVMAGVDPSRPGPLLTSPEEAARAWDHGGLSAWRGQIAIIASNPWAPYGNELRELALAADRTETVHAIDEAIKVYRSRFERRERELVAREIRELVAMSGLSQREFAALAGTSASRLSTYVNGLVTPSATMMVRVRRVSELVQRRRADGTG